MNDIYQSSEKKIYSRGSVIPSVFNYKDVLIHSGSRWVSKRVGIWIIGYRFGEFTWNRKYAIFKAKSKKKKKK